MPWIDGVETKADNGKSREIRELAIAPGSQQPWRDHARRCRSGAS